MNEIVQQLWHRVQVLLQFVTDRHLEIMSVDSRPGMKLDGAAPRLVNGSTNLTAHPDGNVLDALNGIVNSVRGPMTQNIVDLADMADWILSGSRFGTHWAIQTDEPIHAIAASHLSAIGSFGGRPQYGQIHAPLTACGIVECVDRQFDQVEHLELPAGKLTESFGHRGLAFEVLGD